MGSFQIIAVLVTFLYFTSAAHVHRGREHGESGHAPDKLEHLKKYPGIRPYFLQDSANFDTLKFVQVMHRHGDRNRLAGFVTDPHKDVQIGAKTPGELTAIGKANGFELGKYLRSRYDGFLSSIYSVDEITAKSSFSDRTIMTGLNVLAGLFPPVENDAESNWNSKLNWQSIPIRPIDVNQDSYYHMGIPCPKYNTLLAEYKESDVYKKYIDDHKEFYAYLTKHSGNEVTDVDSGLYVIDTLLVEKAHGFNMPEWTNEPGFWAKADEIVMHKMEITDYPTLLKKLFAGTIVTDIMTNMETKRTQIETKSSGLPKMIENSAHDSTIVELLNAWGVTNIKPPTYASALLIELHKDNPIKENEDPYFVKVFFRNETTAPAYEIEIPNCGPPCSLNKLKEISSEIVATPEEWTELCKA